MKLASIYGIDLNRALSLLLQRLSTHIGEHKVKFNGAEPAEAGDPSGMASKEQVRQSGNLFLLTLRTTVLTALDLIRM